MKTIQAKMHNSISWAIFTGLAALFLFQGFMLSPLHQRGVSFLCFPRGPGGFWILVVSSEAPRSLLQFQLERAPRGGAGWAGEGAPNLHISANASRSWFLSITIGCSWGSEGGESSNLSEE
ncbi:hypothetical protein VULLAG_LOCUS21240 [Vulpes lagopus]